MKTNPLEHLKVTIIQSHLHWENPVANRAHFSEKIKDISEETQLIILPEMFTTGFTMNAAPLAEETDGTNSTMDARSTANEKAACRHRQRHCHGRWTGILIGYILFFPNGTYEQYDKKHTFTLAGEHKTFAAGEERIIVAYEGWKICPLICYDLRFPVWARNTSNYDLLIICCQLAKKDGFPPGMVYLKARAIENMAYCIGVNRVGLDGNGFEYNGQFCRI